MSGGPGLDVEAQGRRRDDVGDDPADRPRRSRPPRPRRSRSGSATRRSTSCSRARPRSSASSSRGCRPPSTASASRRRGRSSRAPSAPPSPSPLWSEESAGSRARLQAWIARCNAGCSRVRISVKERSQRAGRCYIGAASEPHGRTEPGHVASAPRRGLTIIAVALAALVVGLALVARAPAEDLNAKLDAKQAELDQAKEKKGVLTTEISRYNDQIDQLTGEVAALRTREAAVQEELDRGRGRARRRAARPADPPRAARPDRQGARGPPRRHLQVRRAERDLDRPRVRRLRRRARPLRVPAADPGPGTPRSSVASASSATTPPRPSSASARPATRSPPRRPSWSAPARSSRRARPQLDAARDRSKRALGRIDEHVDHLEGDVSDIQKKIQEQLAAASGVDDASGRPDPGRLRRLHLAGQRTGRLAVRHALGPHARGRRHRRPGRHPDPRRQGRHDRLRPVGGRERRLRQLHLHRPRRRALDLLRPPVELRDHVRLGLSRAT